MTMDFFLTMARRASDGILTEVRWAAIESSGDKVLTDNLDQDLIC